MIILIVNVSIEDNLASIVLEQLPTLKVLEFEADGPQDSYRNFTIEHVKTGYLSWHSLSVITCCESLSTLIVGSLGVVTPSDAFRMLQSLPLSSSVGHQIVEGAVVDRNAEVGTFGGQVRRE